MNNQEHRGNPQPRGNQEPRGTYNAEAVATQRAMAKSRYLSEYAEKDEWSVLCAIAKEGPWFFSEMQAAGLSAQAFADSRASFVWSSLSAHIAEGRPMSEDALIRTIDEMIERARARAAKDEKFKPNYLNLTGEKLTGILMFTAEYQVDTATAEFLGKRLVSRYQFRKMERELARLTADATTWTESPEKFVEHVQARIMAMPVEGSTGRGVKNVADHLPAFLDAKYAAYDAGNPVTGLLTGFPRLDRVTKGLQPGNLVVIAAGSGVGKSSMAINIAAHVARAGKRALIFSLEMTIDEIMERLVWMSAEIDSADYYLRMMDDAKWDRISRATVQMQAQNLDVVDDSSLTLPALASIATRHAFTAGVDMVIVDYAQLLGLGEGGKESNREQEVRAVSAGLKRLANSLGVPVIVLSQLNDDGKVRESRALKFDASHLWILKKSDCQDGLVKDGPSKRYELFVEKGRNSSDDMTIRMLYWASQTRLEEESDEVEL